MKRGLQSFFRANGSRSAKARSSCAIHSAKTLSRFDRAFWSDCSRFSIEIFAPARNALPSLKLVAHSFPQRGKKNVILEFCSGEMSRARRIGDRKQIAASIYSI